jgi:hypothetical protein
MGNSLLRSSEYKEMKKMTKKNTVINSNIPPMVDDYKPQSQLDKNVSFKSAVSVQHFDIEDGESFGEIISEPVYDPYDTDPAASSQPAPAAGGQRSPLASAGAREGGALSSGFAPAAPARALKPTDSIVVAKLKKPGEGGGSPLPVRTESPTRSAGALNGRD